MSKQRRKKGNRASETEDGKEVFACGSLFGGENFCVSSLKVEEFFKSRRLRVDLFQKPKIKRGMVRLKHTWWSKRKKP